MRTCHLEVWDGQYTVEILKLNLIISIVKYTFSYKSYGSWQKYDLQKCNTEYRWNRIPYISIILYNCKVPDIQRLA